MKKHYNAIFNNRNNELLAGFYVEESKDTKSAVFIHTTGVTAPVDIVNHNSSRMLFNMVSDAFKDVDQIKVCEVLDMKDYDAFYKLITSKKLKIYEVGEENDES